MAHQTLRDLSSFQYPSSSPGLCVSSAQWALSELPYLKFQLLSLVNHSPSCFILLCNTDNPLMYIWTHSRCSMHICWINDWLLLVIQVSAQMSPPWGHLPWSPIEAEMSFLSQWLCITSLFYISSSTFHSKIILYSYLSSALNAGPWELQYTLSYPSV